MPGSLPPLQLVADPATRQNFDVIQLAWAQEPLYAGSGSPEGVVSAGPGAEYVDRATGQSWSHEAAVVSATGWVLATSVRAATRVRVVTGGFTCAAPPVVNFAGTGGWTVARGGVGNYTVTFTTAFGSANVVPAVTVFAGGTLAPDVTVCNATTLTVLVFNAAGGAVDPGGLLFHAIGPV